MAHKRDSVVLLGDWGVGKSSMLAAHTTGEAQTKGVASTIGMSFCCLERASKEHPGGINCWDTAGQERYRSLIPMYTRGAGAFICVVPSVGPYDERSVITPITQCIKSESYENLIQIALVMSKNDISSNVERVLGPLETQVKELLFHNAISAEVTIHSCSALDPPSCSAVFDSCVRKIKDARACISNSVIVVDSTYPPPHQKRRFRCC